MQIPQIEYVEADRRGLSGIPRLAIQRVARWTAAALPTFVVLEGHQRTAKLLQFVLCTAVLEGVAAEYAETERAKSVHFVVVLVVQWAAGSERERHRLQEEQPNIPILHRLERQWVLRLIRTSTDCAQSAIYHEGRRHGLCGRLIVRSAT